MVRQNRMACVILRQIPEEKQVLTSAKLMAFIPTRDPATARAFYERVVGLRFVDEDGFATTVEAAGGIRIRLTRIDNHKPVQFTILGWETPDIEKAVSDLESRGVVFGQFGLPDQDARGVWTAPGGAKVAWFNDPDGNTLSLTQFP
jgi:catechol 2,3-dioxygenase-like lactoylglutathione lyase family enzyme